MVSQRPQPDPESSPVLSQAAGNPDEALARDLPFTPQTLSDDQRSLRILLAEDNPASQKILAARLTRWGHAVIVVSTGQEAVAAYTTPPFSFDLILMDIQMPDLNGLDATRPIRSAEHHTRTRVPILAMTGYGKEKELDALQAGMDGLLSKPVDAEQLSAFLHTFSQPLPSTPTA